jgi:hypothetical protein
MVDARRPDGELSPDSNFPSEMTSYAPTGVDSTQLNVPSLFMPFVVNSLCPVSNRLAHRAKLRSPAPGNAAYLAGHLHGFSDPGFKDGRFLAESGPIKE